MLKTMVLFRYTMQLGLQGWLVELIRVTENGRSILIVTRQSLAVGRYNWTGSNMFRFLLYILENILGAPHIQAQSPKHLVIKLKVPVDMSSSLSLRREQRSSHQPPRSDQAPGC